jgi:Domain of unknown function (DUF4328)/Ankyrin repeats (3 copies)
MSREKLNSAKNLFFIALVIDIAVTALVAITDFWAVGVLNDIRSGVTTTDQSTISTLEFWGDFAKVIFLTTIGVGLALLRWLNACYRYAKETLMTTGFAQEGWKTWGWIVPFMNLFKPYKVINEIYKVGAIDYLGGDEWKKSSGSGMLLFWWVFWVITHMVMWGIGKQALKSTFRDDLTLNQIIGMYYGNATVCVISLIVAALWFVVAGSLTRRLLSRSVPVVSSVAPAHVPAANESAVPAAKNFTKAAYPENLSAASLQTVVDEDRIYAEIAKELETGVTDSGLWTRLFAECDGDEKQTKVRYIKERADRLISSERSRLEQAAYEQAAESTRLEKLRLQSLSLREKLSEENITKELSDTLRALSKTYPAVTVLNEIRLNKLSKVAAMLMEEPLLVAVTNSEGDTPLHIAVREKYLEMVQLLLEKGALVEAKNMYGVTPMDSANKSGQIEIANLLVAAQPIIPPDAAR